MATSIGDMVVRILGDNADFNKSIDSSQKKFTKFGKEAEKIGKSLTTYVTLPILGVATASVKLASDFGESLNKIDVAFGKSQDVVLEWSKTTADTIGVASGAALDAIAVIGDMATSMGLAEDAAADMGIQLVNRAGDLASFKNISIEVANTALKGVFTGETESLKQLGVVMTQAQLEAFALAEGYKKTFAEMTQAEKVTLRYQFVMKATNNAAGDFAETLEGSLANQTRALTANLKDSAVTIGNALLPQVLEITKKIVEFSKKIAELNDDQVQTIIKVAALAAAMGPLATGIGIATKAVNGLKVAMTFLAANPIVAVVSGIAAITAGLVLLVKAKRDAQLEELETQFANVGAAAGLVPKELELIQDALSQTSRGYGDLDATINSLNETYGYSKDAIIAIGLESEYVTDEYKDQLQLMQDQVRLESEREKLSRDNSENEEIATNKAEARAVAQHEITDAMKEQVAIQDAIIKAAEDEELRLKGVIEGRIESLESYNKEIEYIENKNKLGLLSEKEFVAAKISLEEGYQETLLKIGFDGVENAKGVLDIGDIALNESIQRRTELLEALAELEKEISTDVTEFKIDNIWAEFDARKAKEAEEDTLFQKAIDDRATREKEASDARISLAQSTVDVITSLNDRQRELELRGYQTTADTEIGILKARTDQELETLKAKYESDKELEGLTSDEKEKLYKDYSAAKEAIDTSYSDSKKAIDEELAKETRRLNHEEAKQNKAAALFNIAVNTAVAVSKLLARPILAVAAGVAGAAQAISVLAQPLPALAQGGIITPQPGGVPVTVAEAGQSEVIFPLDKLDSFLSKRSEPASTGAFGRGSQPIIIQLDHQQFIDAIIKTNQNAMSDQTMNLGAMQMGA